MSTKNLRSALQLMREDKYPDLYAAALSELEAIEEAARFLASTSQDQDAAHKHMMVMEKIAEETR